MVLLTFMICHPKEVNESRNVGALINKEDFAISIDRMMDRKQARREDLHLNTSSISQWIPAILHFSTT
jgi:hypothetical protein